MLGKLTEKEIALTIKRMEAKYSIACNEVEKLEKEIDLLNKNLEKFQENQFIKDTIVIKQGRFISDIKLFFRRDEIHYTDYETNAKLFTSEEAFYLANIINGTTKNINETKEK